MKAIFGVYRYNLMSNLISCRIFHFHIVFYSLSLGNQVRKRTVPQKWLYLIVLHFITFSYENFAIDFRGTWAGCLMLGMEHFSHIVVFLNIKFLFFFFFPSANVQALQNLFHSTADVLLAHHQKSEAHCSYFSMHLLLFCRQEGQNVFPL